MNTYFELWHIRSGNHAGDFNSEEDALAFLATELASSGPKTVAEYGLSEEPDPDNAKPVWSGDELVKRVRAFVRGELAPSLPHTA
jgi:hypothetical protein